MTESTTSIDVPDEKSAPCPGWGQNDVKNADLKIVSSDGMSYWFSSTILSHHSSVFASMISTCGNTSNTVHLTTHDIEDGFEVETILMFILAIDNSDSDDLADLMYDRLNPHTIIFAKKYEMNLVIAEIKMYLFGLIAQWPPTGGQYFLEAAHLGEWSLCGRLIATLANVRPDESDKEKYTRRMLDWRGWTSDIMDEMGRVSAKFSWAVCYAGTHHAGRNKDKGIYYEGMGEELAKLMTSDINYEDEVNDRWKEGPSVWWGA